MKVRDWTQDPSALNAKSNRRKTPLEPHGDQRGLQGSFPRFFRPTQMLGSFRLSRAELRVAAIGFTFKLILFWVAQELICEIDAGRRICGLVERGFVPCLISFALMDGLILPQLRRHLKGRRQP